MPFIRVTDVQSKQVIDLNIAHIVAFTPVGGTKAKGSLVSIDNGESYHVEDETRQIRGYIMRAEGTLPEKGSACLS